MDFATLKETLFQIIIDLELNYDIQNAIQKEINGIYLDPSENLVLLHGKLQEKGLTDKIVKRILLHEKNKINQLYGFAAILDYYLIFLGFNLPIGGVDWLKNNDDIIYWYKNKIHTTNYGRIALKHKFGSIYEFKVLVAKACENWLFKKWRFFKNRGMKDDDVLNIKNQISEIKNARLIIDINMLQNIFEFNVKNFFHYNEIFDFLNSYNFDIKKFEEHLIQQIDEFGCEYRKRLDNCYELIFA